MGRRLGPGLIPRPHRPRGPDAVPASRHHVGMSVVQLYYIVSPRLPRIQREQA